MGLIERAIKELEKENVPMKRMVASKEEIEDYLVEQFKVAMINKRDFATINLGHSVFELKKEFSSRNTDGAFRIDSSKELVINMLQNENVLFQRNAYSSWKLDVCFRNTDKHSKKIKKQNFWQKTKDIFGCFFLILLSIFMITFLFWCFTN